VAQLQIDFDETLAVGDGANDLAMIRKAGLGAPITPSRGGGSAGAAINHND